MNSNWVTCDDCGALVPETADGLSLREHGCWMRQRRRDLMSRAAMPLRPWGPDQEDPR